MTEMTWRAAVRRVLSESEGPLHYAEIAQHIIDNDYRRSTGATPAATVAAVLSQQLVEEVVRVDRGVYTLASRTSELAATDASTVPPTQQSETTDSEDSSDPETGFLNAFGMFWRRDEVDWEQRGSSLWGAQLKASDSINFAEQVGVYILYSGERVIYVGRITEARLGPRLWEHTRDRLSGRWDRFSWFGVRAVGPDGRLGAIPSSAQFGVSMLVVTMEALLIEGLEPPQNRRRGDGFNATEFIQQTDPEIERKRRRAMLQRLLKDD